MAVMELARQLGTTDRTLRRLAEVGLIRLDGRRRGLRWTPRREAEYLVEHWQVLTDLRAALRTEPSVVAALVFGSVATGADTPSSDVDLVVALQGEPSLGELRRLGDRIARKIGRRVDLFNLDDLLAEPDRLAPVVDEARPVVDRAYVWPRLVAHRRRLGRRRPKAARRRLSLDPALT